MAKKTVNGYTIIASRAVSRAPGEYAILAHRVLSVDTEGNMNHEYVTAWMRSLDDLFWSSGYYTRSLSDAASAFKSMTGGS